MSGSPIESFVERLAAARIGRTFNFYREGDGAALRRERLARHLAAHAGASILLVGEAPGYRGARVSGIPFTSERQLTGAGAAEASATVVRRTLALLGLQDEVLCWNVVPTHPGTDRSNRRPTRGEVEGGRPFLELLARGRRTIAVGRLAHGVLGGDRVRHPSHGGAAEFAAGLRDLLACGRYPVEPTRSRPCSGAPCYTSPPADALSAFFPHENVQRKNR